MKLQRCPAQKSGTLIGFYREWADSPNKVSASIGNQMLDLLLRLDDAPPQITLWGLTSHSTLQLHRMEHCRDLDFVRIQALPEAGFRIEYRVPSGQTPWPAAYVHGHAKTTDEALTMIATAIERSGGWA